MGLFSRKKPAAAEPSARPAQPAPKGFHLVLEVGDTDSRRTVDQDVLDQLVRATKAPALAALDRRFGGESWCSEIHTHASLEGPVIYFNLDLTIPPGQTLPGMQGIVSAEFRRRWDEAAARFLA